MVRICVHLDRESTSSVPKYKFIAEDKFKDLSHEERNKIVNDLCDNGNNGMEFLKVLETRVRDLTCSHFSTLAYKLKREDIKRFLEKRLDRPTISDLDLDDKTTLAPMLSTQNTTIKGWRNFADEFGFSREDKHAIENSNKITIVHRWPC